LEKLIDKALAMNMDFASNELVLDLQRSQDGNICCGYYLVDDDTRTLFWLDEFDASSLLTEVRGITSPSHMKHEIESQYWLHWELYPSHHHLTPLLLTELKEILVHASGGKILEIRTGLLENNHRCTRFAHVAELDLPIQPSRTERNDVCREQYDS
jgi:hypothetical protein